MPFSAASDWCDILSLAPVGAKKALNLDSYIVEIAGKNGRRSLPLKDLYTHDSQTYLSLGAEEFVCSVTAWATPGLRTAYDKIRVRRSIEFPLAGVAVALSRDGEQLSELRVAFTGTNPGPVLLEGTARCAAAASTWTGWSASTS